MISQYQQNARLNPMQSFSLSMEIFIKNNIKHGLFFSYYAMRLLLMNTVNVIFVYIYMYDFNLLCSIMKTVYANNEYEDIRTKSMKEQFNGFDILY